MRNAEKGFTIWITGPSGAGKTTLANALKEKITELGYKAEVLDGDLIRRELYPELGFSKEEREIHNRVVIYLAKVLNKCGIIAIVSIVSPYRITRELARKEIENFVEVYVNAPLEVRMARDPKGLYSKAIKGEIKNLTGYDGVYEESENLELVLDTSRMSVEEEVEVILKKLKDMGYL